MTKVKIKSYNELKDKDWFVEDMKIYCGRTTELNCEVDDGFYTLFGCSDWQWSENGFTYL